MKIYLISIKKIIIVIAYLTMSNERKSPSISHKMQCQIVLNWIFFLSDTFLIYFFY